MFHLEHYDLCSWLGVKWLAELHKDGYEHDSTCLRKMRHECVRHLGVFAPEGRQERSRYLDAFRQQRRCDVKSDVRKTAIDNAMHDWIDWEDGTVSLLTNACGRLESQGCLLLADRVRRVAKDTSVELAEAKELLLEMEAVDWDMSHIIDMR